MSQFVKAPSAYLLAPSSYITCFNFVRMARQQGVKHVFEKYAPCLKISKHSGVGLRFEYQNDVGRDLATSIKVSLLNQVPAVINTIFVSADYLLVGAHTTSRKPIGMETLILVSKATRIPLPKHISVESRQELANYMLHRGETIGSGKISFFSGGFQYHISKTGLGAVGICTLSKLAIQRIPWRGGDTSEILTWVWLEYLLRNHGSISEKVSNMVKASLLTNSTWIAEALGELSKEE